MKSIQLTSHVGKDGILALRMPVDIKDQEVDVVVVIHPRSPVEPVRASKGWPAGFVSQTAGAWQGAPLVRPSQGELEERDLLQG